MTPQERLQQLLEAFKAAEPTAGVDEALADEPTRRVLAAWRRVPAEISEPLVLGGVPMHRHNRWKYVWKFRRIRYDAVMAEAGMTDLAECRRILEGLMERQLIYPDGTLHRGVAGHLAARDTH
jgi:hypothetical protein